VNEFTTVRIFQSSMRLRGTATALWLLTIPKRYAAGLEIRRPGDACFKLGP
jgi:hypothetical protein